MDQFFLYLVLGLLAFGYVCAVVSCMFESVGDAWWEPWVMGALMPFMVVVENWRGIAGTFRVFGALGAVVWLLVLVADFFRWVGTLL